MLDIKVIRQDPERVKTAMKNRNKDMDREIDEILQIDVERRAINTAVDNMKAEQNRVSKLIPQYKKEGKDIAPIMAEMKELSEKIKEEDAKLSELEAKQDDIIHAIPNIPNETVPIGRDDTENVELRRWGEPTHFDYEPLAHWDIGADLGILDPETAAKVTGKRFHFYRGLGCRLERSIIAFFMDTHSAHGYTEIFPPFIANRDSMTGTGQLPKFAEDMFKLEGMDYYLIPTAEVPVTNMYRGDILDGNKLPLCFCAYSACFRAEAGSAGRDTRGLIRQHEFNKVELVKFTKPEESDAELEKLTADAERVLQLLGLPYRVVVLSTGDLGFSSAKTYDIEERMTSYRHYVEITTSNDKKDYKKSRANIH